MLVALSWAGSAAKVHGYQVALRSDSAIAQVHQAFRVVWADHGDDISRQYAGTGALKSGFTRTGKRTTMGLLDDGVKSMTRYYLNTFQDGQKQDALDLASGAYRVEAGAQYSPEATLLKAQICSDLPRVDLVTHLSELPQLAQLTVIH